MGTKHQFKTLKGIITIVMTLATSGIANAAVPKSVGFWTHSSEMDFSRGLNLKSIQPIESLRIMKSEDIALIIPDDLSPSSDGGQIASQILDHSLSNLFNSDAVKKSDLGRTAQVVEKSMEGDLAFGGETPDSIKHSLKFAMRASQTRAMVEYSGITKAQLSYSISQQRVQLEVEEEMAANTQLVFNHSNTRTDRTDMLSLRWIW